MIVPELEKISEEIFVYDGPKGTKSANFKISVPLPSPRFNSAILFNPEEQVVYSSTLRFGDISRISEDVVGEIEQVDPPVDEEEISVWLGDNPTYPVLHVSIPPDIRNVTKSVEIEGDRYTEYTRTIHQIVEDKC